MVHEVSYTTVMNVCLSWDALKKTEQYEQKAGDLIFERYEGIHLCVCSVGG